MLAKAFIFRFMPNGFEIFISKGAELHALHHLFLALEPVADRTLHWNLGHNAGRHFPPLAEAGRTLDIFGAFSLWEPWGIKMGIDLCSHFWWRENLIQPVLEPLILLFVVDEHRLPMPMGPQRERQIREHRVLDTTLANQRRYVFKIP